MDYFGQLIEINKVSKEQPQSACNIERGVGGYKNLKLLNLAWFKLRINFAFFSAGRIIFELFAYICPKTSDNFRALCTGKEGRINVDTMCYYYHYQLLY